VHLHLLPIPFLAAEPILLSKAKKTAVACLQRLKSISNLFALA
jgi:hypothetical protein